MIDAKTGVLNCSFASPEVKFGQNGHTIITKWKSIDSCYVYVFKKYGSEYRLCWKKSEEPAYFRDTPMGGKYLCTFPFKRTGTYYCLFSKNKLSSIEINSVQKYGFGLLKVITTRGSHIQLDNTLVYWTLMAQLLERHFSDSRSFLNELVNIYNGTSNRTYSENEIFAKVWIYKNRYVLLSCKHVLDMREFLKAAAAHLNGEKPLWSKEIAGAIDYTIDIKNNPGRPFLKTFSPKSLSEYGIQKKVPDVTLNSLLNGETFAKNIKSPVRLTLSIPQYLLDSNRGKMVTDNISAYPSIMKYGSTSQPYALKGIMGYRDQRYDQKLNGSAYFGSLRRTTPSFRALQPYNNGIKTGILENYSARYTIKEIVEELKKALSRLPEKNKYDRTVCLDMIKAVVSYYKLHNPDNIGFHYTIQKDTATSNYRSINSELDLFIPSGHYTNRYSHYGILKAASENFIPGNSDQGYIYKDFDLYENEEAFDDQLHDDLRLIGYDLYYATTDIYDSYIDLIPKDWHKISGSGFEIFWEYMGPWVHGFLDVAGFIPVFGEAFDLINALIYAVEGNYSHAILSMAAMIPFVGWVSTAGKTGKKLLQRVSTDAIQEAISKVLTIENVKTILANFKKFGTMRLEDARIIYSYIEQALKEAIEKIYTIIQPLVNVAEGVLVKRHGKIINSNIKEILEDLPSELMKNNMLKSKLAKILKASPGNKVISGDSLHEIIINTLTIQGKNTDDVNRLFSYLYKATNRKGKRLLKEIPGIDEVIADLAKGGNWYTGAEWVLRYIDDKNVWDKIYAFEHRIGADLRILDAMIYEGSELFRYEFKSWKKFHKGPFQKQFPIDFSRGLDDLRWVFDRREGFFVNKDDLMECLKKVIDNTFTKEQAYIINTRLNEIIIF